MHTSHVNAFLVVVPQNIHFIHVLACIHFCQTRVIVVMPVLYSFSRHVSNRTNTILILMYTMAGLCFSQLSLFISHSVLVCLQRLLSCRTELCQELCVNRDSLELSMGMTNDMESAVSLFPHFSLLMSGQDHVTR